MTTIVTNHHLVTFAAEYRILEHLSRGHDLDVWAAWSQERDCSCVIKTLRPDRVGDDRSRALLLREGQLITALTHPHLVRGYELLDPPCRVNAPGPVLVMETLTGATLSHLIHSQYPQGMEPDDTAMLGLHLCAVLCYLHRRGILHLDLKPSNVLCAADKAVLIDLSLTLPTGTWCEPGLGTVEYMAPEQVAGGLVDPATDVWGLGGVLYRAMTGKRPFPNTDRPRTSHDQVDLATLGERLHPHDMRELVSACFEQRPADRPTLTEARTVLHHHAHSEDIPTDLALTGADVPSF